jgi:hypothetical protein
VIWVEWDVHGAADDEVDVVALLLDPGVLVSCLGDPIPPKGAADNEVDVVVLLLDPGVFVSCLGDPIPPKGAADDEVDVVALLDDLDFFLLSSPLKKFSSINGTLGGSIANLVIRLPFRCNSFSCFNLFNEIVKHFLNKFKKIIIITNKLK